jgi:hypothetical protein
MNAPFGKKSSLQTKLLWTAVVILGVVSFGIVALNRGESVNAACAFISLPTDFTGCSSLTAR